MKINSERLKSKAREAGLSDEALAAAVVRPGLSDREALAAVRNWKAGRDHPRCKAGDITRLAQVLACGPLEITRFVSVARFQRSSPRKAALLAELIRGRSVVHAEDQLRASPKRAAKMVLKALRAAIADAEQADADVAALVVSESRVNSGLIIKRFQPKDRGRAHAIQKKTSHIIVGVEEAA